MTKSDSGFSPDALARVLFDRLHLAADISIKIAYSGGLDSHVLLHALATLRATLPLRLAAIHVDHGLLPQAQAWSQHCMAVCAELRIPCAVERVQVAHAAGDGTEAAARRARYAALARHVGQGEVLLTAHHQDDQAETVMLQLLRGAGAHGLAGMPALCDFSAGGHARPLLAFSRQALRAYAEAERLHWVEDPSNKDVSYRRNLLRHELFPLLERHWPHAAGMLARSAQHAGACIELLDELAAADKIACRWQETAAVLSISRLLTLSPARQRNVLRYWLRVQGFLAPSTRHLEEVVGQLACASRTGHARFTWPGTEIWRYRDQLHVLSPLPPLDPGLDIFWDMAGPMSLPALGGRLAASPVAGQGIARTRLGAGVHIRLRQGGEVCRLPGRRHHHKLKKLLQDQGVVPWQRERLPLLYAGDDLVAVADLWVCEPYAAGPGEPGWQIHWQTLVSTPERA